jgi:hypothetical protein
MTLGRGRQHSAATMELSKIVHLVPTVSVQPLELAADNLRQVRFDFLVDSKKSIGRPTLFGST